LSIVPTRNNPGNTSYEEDLEFVLGVDANATPAMLIQALASAGWNSKDTNYGSRIANGIKGFPRLINCLLQNYANIL